MNSTAMFVVENKIPKMAAFFVTILISLIGNAFIIWSLYKDSRLRNPLIFFVANMALSDLCSTFISYPLYVVLLYLNGEWLITDYSGRALCKLLPYMIEVSSAISQYTCMFIALERCFASCKMKFRRSRVDNICIFTWFLSALLTTPLLYYRNVKSVGDKAICLLEPYPVKYMKILSLLVDGLPIFIVIIVYLYVCFGRKGLSAVVDREECVERRERKKRENRDMSKLSFMVISLTSINALISLVVVNFGKKDKIDLEGSEWNGLNFAFLFIARLCVCYNFFILLRFSMRFRKQIRKILVG